MTPARLSNSTSPTVGPASASPTVTTGSAVADLLPHGVGGIQRGDDEAVDELVGELACERALALGVALGVDEHHLQLVAAELAAQRLDEALLVEVLERARRGRRRARAAAGERAGDRVPV